MLCLAPLLFLHACASEKPAASKEPPVVLENPKYKYRITFPPGWSLHVHDSIYLRDLARQAGGTYHADGIYTTKKRWATETVVWPKTGYNSFERVYSDNLKNAIKSFGPLEGTVSKEESYSRDGNEHREVIYETRGGNQPWARHKTTFIDRPGYVLIIHSSCVIRDFDAAKEDFDSIADSLEFF